jgi:hypothetical protein
MMTTTTTTTTTTTIKHLVTVARLLEGFKNTEFAPHDLISRRVFEADAVVSYIHRCV